MIKFNILSQDLDVIIGEKKFYTFRDAVGFPFLVQVKSIQNMPF